MKVEANVKQELIVDAAIRRFSHFGIAKTTLTEVAEDMAVSKQALSYYFADKQSLVNAVIEKITIEYGDRLRTEMGKAATVEAALLKLTEVKGFFFREVFYAGDASRVPRHCKGPGLQQLEKIIGRQRTRAYYPIV